MSYEDVKNSRKRLKDRLLYVMGNKCQLCGYDKCESALEFHHINPDEKSFSITQNANIGTERALNEAKKCALLCCLCHRELHAGLIQDVLISPYDENKAQEILSTLKRIKEGEEKEERFCSECGKPITEYSTTGMCSACVNKSRRVTERPNREELKQLVRTVPFTQIARQFGVSDKAISKWCVAENIPSTKRAINALSDEEWAKI